jgi:hypothetical protein
MTGIVVFSARRISPRNRLVDSHRASGAIRGPCGACYTMPTGKRGFGRQDAEEAAGAIFKVYAADEGHAVSKEIAT